MMLAELPKTVNGKLDNSALPEWSPSRSERGYLTADEFDELTVRVIQTIADVTGFAGQIRPSDDFINDLGGTSLDIVRVLVELERDSGKRIRMNDVLADTSVAGFADLLRGETVSPLADFAFNTNGDAPPLFLIHAYFGGMLGFRRLAELLPPNQPVYGLQVYCTSEQVDDELTISSLAQDALKRIREIQPTGRITMAGHSAGGLIVFEAARKLNDAGDPEPRVLLMDSARALNAFEHHWAVLLLSWREMIGNPGKMLRRAVTKLFRAVRPRESHWQDTAQNGNLMVLTESYREPTDVAIMRYRAQIYSGSITVMRTRQGRIMALGRRCLGWASVTRGALGVIDVPGGHISMMEVPYIHVVAGKLTYWLSIDSIEQ
jgi:thioesterase domain-containing protein/acyl carrier protein